MNILILGSGGREHAFAHQISQSNRCKNLFVAPGNAGTASIATNVALKVTDFEAVKKCVLENRIEMVIVVQKIHWSKESPIILPKHPN